MEGTAASTGAGVVAARCAAHPERVAATVCDRCGDYQCSECQKILGGRPLCARCRQIPGVDYLEDTRRRFWGKRDGFVWYFGVVGPLAAIFSLVNATQRADYLNVASSVVWLAFAIPYFRLLPWARVWFLRVSALTGVLGVVRVAFGDTGSLTAEQLAVFGGKAGFMVMGIVSNLFVFVILAAAYFSPRNKLAFEMEVSEAELARVYDAHLSNPLARRAFWYGLLAMLFPFASAITLAMALIAIGRADSKAWPPRGGRGMAIAASVLSALALVGWLALFTR